MQEIDFNGQVAIVTGAGGGIGRGIALLLAQRGAKVLVNDYGGTPFGEAGGVDRADAVAREIRAAGGDAVANATPVGSAAAALQIRDAAMRAFGRIDALVNNAGIVHFGGVADISDADLDRVIEINFLGAFRLLRAVWPVMKEQGYGRILNVASNSSLGFGGMTAYAASKSALLGLTADSAREGQPLGILVNSLLPAAATRLVIPDSDAPITQEAGFVDWLKAHFQPEKVAPTAVYLVSRACSVFGEHYSTGAGRVSRIAHVATDGFHDPVLTPEHVAAEFARIRDTSQSRVITSGIEELGCYMGPVPPPEKAFGP
jgi:NAD(P)-dependent dehydrogenase (short-subunit alcohol dehydrogenase family)